MTTDPRGTLRRSLVLQLILMAMLMAGLVGTGMAPAQPGGSPADKAGEKSAVRAGDDPMVVAVRELRPSVVAIGSYLRTDAPTVKYFGTGFVVFDGRVVITNAHVVEGLRQAQRLEHLRVYFPDTRDVDGRVAKVLLEDATHDVALIAFEGQAAPAVKISSVEPDQGRHVGILGYPLGTRLGLVPAVHEGRVAAVVPAMLPLPVGVNMTPERQAALRNPYNLYQLDMVAFPGNSGSPLFDTRDGTVIGIVNMTLATKTREHLFDKPSGIAYAVPSRWAIELIRRHKATTEAGGK